MEKPEIRINYAQSGVKTLKVLSQVFFILAIVVIILMLNGMATERNFGGTGIFLLYIGGALSSFGFGALLLGVSTIAKTALYKRAILEADHVFTPSTKKKGKKK